MLHRAIDEMRIAIEALASDEKDFRTSFGNFRFRWDQRLRDAGVLPTWQVEVPDAVLAVPPHDSLQLLRIVQEALTNVLKHARAKQVQVSLRHVAGALELQVRDDGVGRAAPPSAGGRGMAGMRARAAKLGARLDLTQDEHGMQVLLVLPLARPGDAPQPSAQAGLAGAAQGHSDSVPIVPAAPATVASARG
jgi:signal transduction histidine kinase